MSSFDFQQSFVDFFEEPQEESVETSAIDNILATIFGVIFIGLFIIFTNQNQLQQANTVMIFIILTVLVAIIGFVDELAERNNLSNKIAQTIKFGANPFVMFLGFFVGGLIGFFLTQGTNSIISPLSVVIEQDFLRLLYINLSAPYIEELFFRGMLIPTAIMISGNVFSLVFDELNARFFGVLFGVIGGNLGFAFFHASLFSPEQLLASFLFGVLATILVYGFKTLTAGIGLHFVNNAVATGLI